MKIDLDKYLTIPQAMAALGASRRAIYRSIERAIEAGHENVTATILGRSLIPVAAIPILKQFYYPYYSKAHQAMVREWGRKGGRQKKINAKAAARKTPRAAKR